MKNKVITNQIKEERIEIFAWCHIVRIQGKGREGFEREVGFWAKPSQSLPTFCQDDKVKPWKFEKKFT